MFEWIVRPEAWVALLTLTSLEIVLGIDNIIFISILVGRLPEKQRDLGRKLGLALALIARLALLFSISWVMGLKEPWFSIFGKAISGRDIILLSGGLFLVAKATHEIHHSLEGIEGEHGKVKASGLISVLLQIMTLDIVFSLDSVITAVGLVNELAIMATAIIIAVFVMMLGIKPIGKFVDDHPTIKILALSFLILVGVTLMVESFNIHVPKGYIYFAMAFSVMVEMLNLRLRRRERRPVKLRKAVHPAKV
ncbi:MAG: TerC family protein [Calditrichaceae bacterium]|nr:TerC family protein [Calditrichaceae bacterium]RQV92948.1 MAG: TerC family protein [Calditrichota bacterium]